MQLLQEIIALCRIGFRFREVDVRLDVARQAGKFFISGDGIFGALALFQDRLRFFLIVPEVGIGNAGF